MCICVFESLQGPSVNLSRHVETSTWHSSPLVLHGEPMTRPTTCTVVRVVVVLHRRLKMLKVLRVASADHGVIPQGVSSHLNRHRCLC